MVTEVTQRVPDPASFADATQRRAAELALEYMGLQPGIPIQDVRIDRVFIGSCTNARLTDLKAAAEIVKGRKVASSVRAIVVPGSQQVKAEAEQLGLHRVFVEAGFEWRESGCSMCLGMNPDILQAWRALCEHFEPQFRGSPGQRRADPSGQPDHGGGRGGRRPFRRRPRMGEPLTPAKGTYP